MISIIFWTFYKKPKKLMKFIFVLQYIIMSKVYKRYYKKKLFIEIVYLCQFNYIY